MKWKPSIILMIIMVNNFEFFYCFHTLIVNKDSATCISNMTIEFACHSNNFEFQVKGFESSNYDLPSYFKILEDSNIIDLGNGKRLSVPNSHSHYIICSCKSRTSVKMFIYPQKKPFEIYDNKSNILHCASVELLKVISTWFCYLGFRYINVGNNRRKSSSNYFNFLNNLKFHGNRMTMKYMPINETIKCFCHMKYMKENSSVKELPSSSIKYSIKRSSHNIITVWNKMHYTCLESKSKWLIVFYRPSNKQIIDYFNVKNQILYNNKTTLSIASLVKVECLVYYRYKKLPIFPFFKQTQMIYNYAFAIKKMVNSQGFITLDILNVKFDFVTYYPMKVYNFTVASSPHMHLINSTFENGTVQLYGTNLSIGHYQLLFKFKSKMNLTYVFNFANFNNTVQFQVKKPINEDIVYCVKGKSMNIMYIFFWYCEFGSISMKSYTNYSNTKDSYTLYLFSSLQFNSTHRPIYVKKVYNILSAPVSCSCRAENSFHYDQKYYQLFKSETILFHNDEVFLNAFKTDYSFILSVNVFWVLSFSTIFFSISLHQKFNFIYWKYINYLHQLYLPNFVVYERVKNKNIYFTFYFDLELQETMKVMSLVGDNFNLMNIIKKILGEISKKYEECVEDDWSQKVFLHQQICTLQLAIGKITTSVNDVPVNPNVSKPSLVMPILKSRPIAFDDDETFSMNIHPAPLMDRIYYLSNKKFGKNELDNSFNDKKPDENLQSPKPKVQKSSPYNVSHLTVRQKNFNPRETKKFLEARGSRIFKRGETSNLFKQKTSALMAALKDHLAGEPKPFASNPKPSSLNMERKSFVSTKPLSVNWEVKSFASNPKPSHVNWNTFPAPSGINRRSSVVISSDLKRSNKRDTSALMASMKDRWTGESKYFASNPKPLKVNWDPKPFASNPKPATVNWDSKPFFSNSKPATVNWNTLPTLSGISRASSVVTSGDLKRSNRRDERKSFVSSKPLALNWEKKTLASNPKTATVNWNTLPTPTGINRANQRDTSDLMASLKDRLLKEGKSFASSKPLSENWQNNILSRKPRQSILATRSPISRASSSIEIKHASSAVIAGEFKRASTRPSPTGISRASSSIVIKHASSAVIASEFRQMQGKRLSKKSRRSTLATHSGISRASSIVFKRGQENRLPKKSRRSTLATHSGISGASSIVFKRGSSVAIASDIKRTSTPFKSSGTKSMSTILRSSDVNRVSTVARLSVVKHASTAAVPNVIKTASAEGKSNSTRSTSVEKKSSGTKSTSTTKSTSNTLKSSELERAMSNLKTSGINRTSPFLKTSGIGRTSAIFRTSGIRRTSPILKSSGSKSMSTIFKSSGTKSVSNALRSSILKRLSTSLEFGSIRRLSATKIPSDTIPTSPDEIPTSTIPKSTFVLPRDTKRINNVVLPRDTKHANNVVLPRDTKHANNIVLPRDTKHANNIVLPRDTKHAGTAVIPRNTKLASTAAIPKETKQTSTFVLPRDTKHASTLALPRDNKRASNVALLRNTKNSSPAVKPRNTKYSNISQKSSLIERANILVEKRLANTRDAIN